MGTCRAVQTAAVGSGCSPLDRPVNDARGFQHASCEAGVPSVRARRPSRALASVGGPRDTGHAGWSAGGTSARGPTLRQLGDASVRPPRGSATLRSAPPICDESLAASERGGALPRPGSPTHFGERSEESGVRRRPTEVLRSADARLSDVALRCPRSLIRSRPARAPLICMRELRPLRAKGGRETCCCAVPEATGFAWCSAAARRRTSATTARGSQLWRRRRWCCSTRWSTRRRCTSS